MAPNVMIGGGQGVEMMIKNWRFISISQPNIDIQAVRLENGPADSTVATTKTQVVMCENMLRHAFPHLAKSGRGRYLAAKLLGQRFTIDGSTRFSWDSENDRVVSVYSTSDRLTPMLRILVNLENVAFVFDKSLVTLEGRLQLNRMDNTPSPSTRARKRHRTRPRDSIEDDEDDHALDAMLVELGIPHNKRKPPNTSPSVEVIELITPPKKKKQSDGFSVVDLTSPSSPNPSPSNGYINTVRTVDEETEQDEISFSYSSSEPLPPFVYQCSLPEELPSTTGIISTGEESDDPEVLSPEMMAARRVLSDERRGVKQARRLSGRLKDLHSETTRSSGVTGVRKERTVATTVEPPARTTASPAKSRTASPSRSKAASNGSSASKRCGASAGVIAVVQMERSLDTSEVGDSIREALKNHVYNGKPVSFTVAAALNCIMPGVIRWERKDGGSSHFSCAIYYEAVVFLEMIQQKNYKELVAAVQYLQTLVPRSQPQARKSQEEEELNKFFVIIQGMDRALITLNKQQKQKKKNGPAPSSNSPMISFADLQEVAFQLFMDTGAHTKFTTDLEATADYVALLTREIVVASSRATALEELLESVPRYNSFRVTDSGATASVYANAWLRMLQVIPGVSEDKAQCLLDHFPTFDSLMRAYRDPRLSRAQKEDLVADKLHDARIQRALSKRIYTVFCEENPECLI